MIIIVYKRRYGIRSRLNLYCQIQYPNNNRISYFSLCRFFIQRSCCGSRPFSHLWDERSFGSYLFLQPIRCFLKSKNVRKGGLCNGKYITRKKEKELYQALEKGAKALSGTGSVLVSGRSTQYTQIHCESLSDRRGRFVYAGLYGRWTG